MIPALPNNQTRLTMTGETPSTLVTFTTSAMSDNLQSDRPTPSSISRKRRNDLFDSEEVKSILGKRKSEHGPPVLAKRHNTTNTTNDEENPSRPIEQVRDNPRRESCSSSSDLEEPELLVHKRQKDGIIGLFHHVTF